MIGVSIYGCEPYEPPDLNGPNGTWWVGGLDGGVYVYIEDDANTTDNVFQGSIYFDTDKTIWYKGKFKYSENMRLDYKQGYLLCMGWRAIAAERPKLFIGYRRNYAIII